MNEQEKTEIAEIISEYSEFKDVPVKIQKVVGSDYDRCDSSFTGYFVWVSYGNGRWEIWFVVDVSQNGDYKWFVEKIT